MDVSTLHTVTGDLAEYLSEVTESDLRRPVSGSAGDLGDLYLRIVDDTLNTAEPITGQPTPILRANRPDRSSLGAVVDNYGGCGLESRYRQSARLMEDAFRTAPSVTTQPRHMPGVRDPADVGSRYETQITATVIHIWDVAHVLGLPYRPTPELAQRALRATALHIARPPMTVGGAQPLTEPATTADTFDRVLLLAGRRPSGLSALIGARGTG